MCYRVRAPLSLAFTVFTDAMRNSDKAQLVQGRTEGCSQGSVDCAVVVGRGVTFGVVELIGCGLVGRWRMQFWRGSAKVTSELCSWDDMRGSVQPHKALTLPTYMSDPELPLLRFAQWITHLRRSL
ncbi:hypothetical protein LZ31DRAFT_369299 [Colletotrichum somersetense]|nr:hypothetical protein LZ31DRAFT_369299 [Colletotrichum somersetense]